MRDGKPFGYNELVRQDNQGHGGEWQVRMKDGRPRQLGYFRVGLTADEPESSLNRPYRHTGHLNYHVPVNTRLNIPFRVIRDFAVLAERGRPRADPLQGLLHARAALAADLLLLLPARPPPEDRVRALVSADVLFEPLRFRNLEVKNRILRSNISGRFDNYDGSGTQARINWEEKFARGGVGAIISSYVPVHIRGRILPNYAMIERRRPDPVLAGGRRGRPPARLQVHPPARALGPPAGRGRGREPRPEGAQLDLEDRVVPRLRVPGDDARGDRGRRRAASRRGRGGRARRGSTASSCTAPTAT